MEPMKAGPEGSTGCGRLREWEACGTALLLSCPLMSQVQWCLQSGPSDSKGQVMSVCRNVLNLPLKAWPRHPGSCAVFFPSSRHLELFKPQPHPASDAPPPLSSNTLRCPRAPIKFKLYVSLQRRTWESKGSDRLMMLYFVDIGLNIYQFQLHSFPFYFEAK